MEKCHEVCTVLRGLGFPVRTSEFPVLERITGFCLGMEDVGLSYQEELRAVIAALPKASGLPRPAEGLSGN
jgi:hypothetical protein